MSGTEIAMILIGVSVAVLAVFLVQTLRKVQVSLDAAGRTLQEVQLAIRGWKDEIGDLVGNAGELVGSARKLSDRVDEQIGSIEPLMATVRETGEALHEVAGVAHDFSSIWSAKLRKRAEAAAAKEAAKVQREAAAARRAAVAAAGRGHSDLEAAAAAEGISLPDRQPYMPYGDSAGSGYSHMSESAEPPAWLAWMETGVNVARLIARR